MLYREKRYFHLLGLISNVSMNTAPTELDMENKQFRLDAWKADPKDEEEENTDELGHRRFLKWLNND